jgi:excisionase family DNA binding protein
MPNDNALSLTDIGDRGMTPNEVARLLRVSPDRIRNWILSGELGAINTARPRCGRPRYVILAEHMAAFVRARRVVAPPPKPARRKKPTGPIDFYPDGPGK